MQKEYPLNNLSDGFNVKDTKLAACYKDESSVPYVSVKDLLTALDGMFDASNLRGYRGNASGDGKLSGFCARQTEFL